jgi:hypothetical protein
MHGYIPPKPKNIEINKYTIIEIGRNIAIGINTNIIPTNLRLGPYKGVIII